MDNGLQNKSQLKIGRYSSPFKNLCANGFVSILCHHISSQNLSLKEALKRSFLAWTQKHYSTNAICKVPARFIPYIALNTNNYS